MPVPEEVGFSLSDGSTILLRLANGSFTLKAARAGSG
jgi:hypothetical protein